MLTKYYNMRSLTESQSNGILCLIGKWKDLLKLKIWGHWQIYVQTMNLLTKMQTIRINKYLPRIIDTDQRGFMKDGYIGSNILITAFNRLCEWKQYC